MKCRCSFFSIHQNSRTSIWWWQYIGGDSRFLVVCLLFIVWRNYYYDNFLININYSTQLPRSSKTKVTPKYFQGVARECGGKQVSAAPVVMIELVKIRVRTADPISQWVALEPPRGLCSGWKWGWR